MRKDKLDLLQGTLDMLVLRTLTDGPLHGYQIAERIQKLSSDVIKVEEGSLYPALHRMEQRAWVASEWGYSASNRRAKYYRLTRAGRKQLDEELYMWQLMRDAISNVVSGDATNS